MWSVSSSTHATAVVPSHFLCSFQGPTDSGGHVRGHPTSSGENAGTRGCILYIHIHNPEGYRSYSTLHPELGEPFKLMHSCTYTTPGIPTWVPLQTSHISNAEPWHGYGQFTVKIECDRVQAVCCKSPPGACTSTRQSSPVLLKVPAAMAPTTVLLHQQVDLPVELLPTPNLASLEGAGYPTSWSGTST